MKGSTIMFAFGIMQVLVGALMAQRAVGVASLGCIVGYLVGSILSVRETKRLTGH